MAGEVFTVQCVHELVFTERLKHDADIGQAYGLKEFFLCVDIGIV